MPNPAEFAQTLTNYWHVPSTLPDFLPESIGKSSFAESNYELYANPIILLVDWSKRCHYRFVWLSGDMFFWYDLIETIFYWRYLGTCISYIYVHKKI